MSEQQHRAHGPYDTDAEARAAAAPLTAAIRAADPGLGPMTSEIRAARLKARIDYLVCALTDAGVELGEYDARIIAWLADWEVETIQVLVSWVGQAHAAGNLGANWAHHVAAQRNPVGGDAAAPAAPMHLGDLVAGEWTPACGLPYGADVTSERAAVACPACLELLPPARRTGPEFTPDEVDAERALDAYLAEYPIDGPDGGAPCA